MIDLINTPLFGILISIIAFEFGIFINKKTKLAIFNPLLISILTIIIFLLKFNINLSVYNKGANFISFFLSPATVILAVPLYKQLNILKSNLIPILIGISIGCITAIISVSFLIKLFNISNDIGLSLIPKSITTPIGIEVSRQIGGIPSITVVAIIITGILGAIIAPVVCKIFKIKNKIAVGIAIGTSSHALGTTKAMEIGEIEGAMSSLSIGIAGLITVFLAPALIKIF
ncbi:LrgB family protein [Tepidibacter thalassicus]|uniref:TIGR00659 family protein n=1 Tax=Tepidibacter thalassicus DSM 15285 TaxID=1123350 RepID=A0A1M5NR37_9FIRM|nr:LrgB family protein [Tepidibacter thalassicus]SHG92012.1 TIGR00659 family protein [Tepidibacter thalassicus DSM 15285]